MVRRTTLYSAALPMLLALAALGQDHGKPGDKMQMPEMPKPTKEHDWLKPFVGSWDVTVSCTAMGTSKGTETDRMWGDFWLVTDFDGDFMGQPFKGHGRMTYDPLKKKYVTSWSDSMTPALMVMEGTTDASGKKLTMTGMCANMENKVVEHTLVKEIKSADEMVMWMYETSKGQKDPTSMKLEYKRKR